MVEHHRRRAIRPLHQWVVETRARAARHEGRLGMGDLPPHPQHVDPAVVQVEDRVARHLRRRVEFVYTPVHGSWLNMVEVEISVLARQCLKRRIPDIETLGREVSAWCETRNRSKASVEWRFTAEDARTKLRKLYPSIE